MWGRNQDESNKTGSPGWGFGPDPAWPGGSGMYGGRRRSAVSDSGDTGIGTLCSDSLEDDSGSGTTPPSLQLSLHPHSSRDDDSVPVVAITPSSSFSPGSGCRTPASPHSVGRWSQSWYSAKPRTSQIGAPSSLDLKDLQPIRRWSSFTKLPDAQGSLDRGLQYGSRKACRSTSMDLYLPLSSISTCSTTLQRSPSASPASWYQHSSRSMGLDMDRFPSSAHSSPLKQSRLDMKYSPLTEPNMVCGGGQGFGLSSVERSLAQKGERTSPIQPAVRTQMWLAEQMEYRPKSEPVFRLPICVCQFSLLMFVMHFRQKQQILQLHIQIRENELRAQQLLQNHRGWTDDPLSRNSEPTDWLCCHEEIGGKLALAELEALHLNKFFKQVTQKYTEDMKKLEEKVKTRDRYICSLKKKCQRESEQNREKQQRIETLERYLSELPTVEQQEDLHRKAQDLQKTISKLQKNLEERQSLMKEKDTMIESQAKREEELMASVLSLQAKVQQCFSDGVRLPVQDLKQLEGENSQLLQQRNHSSCQSQAARETRHFPSTPVTPTRGRRGQPSSFVQSRPADPSLFVLSGLGKSEVDRLLKEMSLCLLDLQALCNILVQRAQGKEPNLSLLLGIKCKVEEEEELSVKLLEVCRLRKGIDELRRNISERCDHFLGNGRPPPH
uniref:Centrosomal protein 85 like n=1 Tax=Oryzias latipes TaxID=8090 RepID=A0A3P9KFF3_ORYLA